MSTLTVQTILYDNLILNKTKYKTSAFRSFILRKKVDDYEEGYKNMPGNHVKILLKLNSAMILFGRKRIKKEIRKDVVGTCLGLADYDTFDGFPCVG